MTTEEIQDLFTFEDSKGEIMDNGDTLQCVKCSQKFNVITGGFSPLEDHYIEHLKHPYLKCWYSDDGENGILWSLEKWDGSLKCEECPNIGAYYMLNEMNNIGLCENCLDNVGNCGDGKLFKKIEIVCTDSLEGINPQ